MESMNSCLKMKRKAKEETPFTRNGRMLLEGLIAFGNGKSNPIHIFSAEELKRATKTMTNVDIFSWLVILTFTRVL